MASRRDRRVLVVDDDPLIALTTAAILQREGYKTATAFTGEAAVQEARTFQPHLLLTDICMPARNGIETACEIIAFCPSCKVIFISGHTNALDLVQACAPKFSVLAKPIHPRDLLRSIASLLGRGQLGRAA